MHGEVHEESGTTRQSDTPDLAYRLTPTHDCKRTLVEVLEGLRRAGLTVADRVRHVTRLLDRHRGQAWQRLSIRAG